MTYFLPLNFSKKKCELQCFIDCKSPLTNHKILLILKSHHYCEPTRWLITVLIQLPNNCCLLTWLHFSAVGCTSDITQSLTNALVCAFYEISKSDMLSAPVIFCLTAPKIPRDPNNLTPFDCASPTSTTIPY